MPELKHASESAVRQIEHFIEMGIALSVERNTKILLERILLSAKRLANADAGTIYSVTEANTLKFDTFINDSLQIHQGGTSQEPADYPEIPIYINDKVNRTALVTQAAASRQIINIEDAYNTSEEFDKSQARKMDIHMGYRTRSVLTVPMTNHHDELIGVLQLINAMDDNGAVTAFSQYQQRKIHAMASLAAMVLSKQHLIDQMKALFNSLSELLARAIDEKSPYTGEHCRRVPEITMLLARATDKNTRGPLADFSLNDKDYIELSTAAWLHDCGKIATPEYVMDKATKLHTVIDRIELIDVRFELAIAQIRLSTIYSDQSREKLLTQLQLDQAFIHKINKGAEYMSPDLQKRVHDIAERYQVYINDKRQNVLTDDEVLNLTIAKGTLNNKERKIINRHINLTIEMLESLPFPKHLRNVPEYAGGHHEKMDGTGYPKGLTRDQMSVQARIMMIADIFEALTSSDRPYKEAKTLTECLNIMGYMKLDSHIDPDLFDIFVDHKVYMEFASKFLQPSQIDEVDLTKIPGYVLPDNR